MIPDVNLSFIEACCVLCSLCGGLVDFCLNPPFVPFSAPLYTSSVLIWGARFGFPISNILVCFPIKKKRKKVCSYIPLDLGSVQFQSMVSLSVSQ